MKKKVLGVLIVLLLSVIAYYTFVPNHLFNKNQAVLQDTVNLQQDTVALEVPEPKMLFGMVVDSLEIFEGAIKRNESLSDILAKFNVSFTTIHELAQKSKQVFDVRKLVTNRKYTVLYKPDSLKTAHCFVYESSPTEYVIFRLTDSLDITLNHRPVDTVVRTIAGEIEYSLYQTMMDQQASPLLAHNLSEVYAWQIDFFSVQKGDKFKVIFEELQVEGQSVGLGKIIGAYFEHFNSPYYAFYYDQGSGIDYFDEKGNSLRKAFLKAPLKFSRISSKFSNSRLHPVLKIRRPHHGIDYAAPTGTPVMSIGDGIVVSKGYSGGAGHMVKIKHNSVYTTGYLHLSKYGPGIAQGKRVKQGDIIGYVGSTGLSTGPHLDFRFWKNGKAVDPLKVQPPPSEPVNQAHIASYNQEMQRLKSELDRISIPAPTEEIVASSGL